MIRTLIISLPALADIFVLIIIIMVCNTCTCVDDQPPGRINDVFVVHFVCAGAQTYVLVRSIVCVYTHTHTHTHTHMQVIFSILSMTLFYNVNTEQDPYGFMDQDFVKYDNFGDSMVIKRSVCVVSE